jgi:ADP-dependent phosphofructokinase/glucokinase
MIDSERSLVLSVLHHLREGTGGEHFVETPEVIEQFAARFGYRTTLGGTPVRAALAMSALGIGSTVHLVSIDDDVRRLLPADVAYLCSAQQDSTDPHLIVQYPADARLRLGADELVSPGANRLIYPCDRPNAELRLSEELPGALRTASVFLVSGMNSIQERDTLELRLAELIDALESLPSNAVTLYEDGGFHVPEFSQVVRDALAPSLDICSLNEDELMGALARRVDLLDPNDVVEAVRDIAARVPVPIIVLHTRHFALAYGVGATRMRGVLASGTAVSGARYAFGDHATRREVEQLDAGGRRSRAGQALAETLNRYDDFCVVPAFDLDDVARPTTIGLGDSFVGGMVAALVSVGAETEAEAPTATAAAAAPAAAAAASVRGAAPGR